MKNGLKVDFYLLSQEGRDSVLHFACRLTEKAFLSKYRVFVLTASAEDAKSMNTWLWDFRPDSFIPHDSGGVNSRASGLWSEQSTRVPPPVLIDQQLPDMNAGPKSVLVCLDNSTIQNDCGFSRVCHMLASDERTRMQGRTLYAQYRKAGITPGIIRT